MTRGADINEENDRLARKAAMADDIVQRLRSLERTFRMADHPENRLTLHPQPANYTADTITAAADEIERLRDLLRYMVSVEDRPCRLDHHGYCQEHPGGWRPGGCWIAAAKALLPEQENDR